MLDSIMIFSMWSFLGPSNLQFIVDWRVIMLILPVIPMVWRCQNVLGMLMWGWFELSGFWGWQSRRMEACRQRLCSFLCPSVWSYVSGSSNARSLVSVKQFFFIFFANNENVSMISNLHILRRSLFANNDMLIRVRVSALKCHMRFCVDN